MKVSFDAYKGTYYVKGELTEKWQSSIRTLPFVSNVQARFDKKCGLYGITGEFFRLIQHTGNKIIVKDENSILGPIKKYLDELGWASAQIDQFLDIVKDVFFIDNTLNLVKTEFIKYYPLISDSAQLTKKEHDKYQNGTKRISQLLSSLARNYMLHAPNVDDNIFTSIVDKALQQETNCMTEDATDYYTFPFLQQMFKEDLEWMLRQDDTTVSKNIPLLLYYYLCTSIIQGIYYTSSRHIEEITKCEPMFFILKAEKASENHDAVKKGWDAKMPRTTLDCIYGKVLAMDICNTILQQGAVGFYHDILARMSQTPFEDNRETLSSILDAYQRDKREILERRSTEKNPGDPIDISINSYEEFIVKLEQLCRELQSYTYGTRIKKKVYDTLGVRLLERRRSKYVLVLDNEMLIFMIAMITKGRKTKLEDLYKGFLKYGIQFNRSSRLEIEEYLLKLNLLDRKSDSGEAQYVKVVL